MEADPSELTSHSFTTVGARILSAVQISCTGTLWNNLEMSTTRRTPVSIREDAGSVLAPGVLVMEITKFVELAPVLLEQAIKDRFVFKACHL
eukprot:6479935-Amphidinium_carterae.1